MSSTASSVASEYGPQQLYEFSEEWFEDYCGNVIRKAGTNTIKIIANCPNITSPRRCAYLPAGPLIEASKLFQSRLWKQLDDVSETAPIIQFEFNHIALQTLVLFAIWLYSHSTATDWDRDLFELAALEIMSDGNWLLSVVERYSTANWRVVLSYLAHYVHKGFTGNALISISIEYLAFLLAQHDVDFRHFISEWSDKAEFMDAGPILLGEVLSRLEHAQQLKTIGKLVNPTSYVCAKYHKHRSMEERRACRDFVEMSEEPEAEEGGDEEIERDQMATTPNDVDDGFHYWCQDRIPSNSA